MNNIPILMKMTSLSDEELKPVLGNTISYQIYKKFDEEDVANEYTSHCGDFKSIINLENEEITTYCKKIAKNLDKLHVLAEKVNYRDRCLHYKYWLYNEIFKFVKPKNKNVEEVIAYFLELQKHVSKKLKKYHCLFDLYRKNLDELNQFNEEKYLYEYFKYYDNIKNNISSDNSEKEKYNNYLTYIKKIYKKHKDDYCCDYYGLLDNCYHYFICDRDYNPDKLLCKLKGDSSESKCDSEFEILSESEKQRREFEDSKFKEIKPYYFSCKEIKSDEDVPFLSCFVLRKGPRYSDQVTKKASPESLDTTKGYITRAIKKIKNGQCSEKPNNNNNDNFTNFNCTSTSSSQPRENESDLKDEQESNKQNVQLEDTFSSSQEGSKLDFRWTIDENYLGCSNNPSDRIRTRLCKHISHLRNKGEIGKQHPLQATQQDVKKTSPPESLKVSIKSNNFSCYPQESEICKDFLKSFISESNEGITLMESADLKKGVELQKDAESTSVTENLHNTLPDSTDHIPEILEENYSILKNIKFRMSVVASLIIGALITFFIYYKFTGLGRWIRMKIFGKKEMNANFHNNVRMELEMNPPEDLHTNFKEKRGRISYAPM